MPINPHRTFMFKIVFFFLWQKKRVEIRIRWNNTQIRNVNSLILRTICVKSASTQQHQKNTATNFTFWFLVYKSAQMLDYVCVVAGEQRRPTVLCLSFLKVKLIDAGLVQTAFIYDSKPDQLDSAQRFSAFFFSL